MPIEMQELLQLVFDRAASDLHIKANQPPILRVAGKLIRTNLTSLSPAEVQRLIFSILTAEQRKTLEQNYELDCSFGVDGVGRFRVNVYKDRGNYAAALRMVSSRIPSMEELGLPDTVRQLVQKPRGLVL